MDNKQLPTSSDNGRTLCSNCFLFENCSCIDEQNKTIVMAVTKKQREESKQANVKLDKKVSESSAINQECEECQQKPPAPLIQNKVHFNKQLREMSIREKKYKQIIAALEKQLNAQTKILLELKNKNRRTKQQRYLTHQRHSQQNYNFHQQDTPPQMQSYHLLSPKNTHQREEVTCKHSGPQGQPEQQLEPNNTHVHYMTQKVHGAHSPQRYHVIQANSNMAINTAEVTARRIINCETNTIDQTNSMTRKKSRTLKKQPHEKVRDEDIINDIVFTDSARSGVSEEEVRNTNSNVCAGEEILRNANCATIAHGDGIVNDGRLEIGEAEKRSIVDLLGSVAASDMAKYFLDEQKRKAIVMEYQSGTEQNCSQERVGVQPQSKRAVATKRPRIPQSNKRRRIIPGLSQEVSQRPLQPLQINGNNSSDKITYILIGINNTAVPHKYWQSIDFTNASLATRKLLVICFDCKILATHSMSGKSSPAFKDKPFKETLDPLIVEDIIFAVTTRCGVSEEEVRNTIAAVCAQQRKLWEEEIKGYMD